MVDLSAAFANAGQVRHLNDNHSTRMTWTETDRQMMTRALDLAARGIGLVSPSPLVGTVIVDETGKIVGEGFYIYDQLKHAETLALEQAGDKARESTAYVSLEPHAHQGRTPPCTESLIKAGVKRVVAPIEDPNPRVSGRGFAHLRAAGIEVSTGLLADKAARLNEGFIHYMRTGRPFVHLKLAVSLDGKIATRTGDTRWVTGAEARKKGRLPPERLCIIALGKLGGRELGYNSDLDLVFLYRDTPGGESHGEHARLAQRFISFLQMPLREGLLYKIDTRLRPSGNQGALVTSASGLPRSSSPPTKIPRTMSSTNSEWWTYSCRISPA